MPGNGERGESDKITKGQKNTSESDGYTNYLDCANSLIGV